MAKRVFGLTAAMAVLVATTVGGMATTASAAEVGVGSGGLSGVCHATLTVVPSGGIFWAGGREGWLEQASLSGDGTCGAAWHATLTGTWSRTGFGRGPAGDCPHAVFRPQIHMTSADGSFDTSPVWQEMTSETGTAPSRQVIGINPSYFGVPFGTDTIVVPVATEYGVVDTDPRACAEWPTGDGLDGSPPLPASPFQVTVDWPSSVFPGLLGSGDLLTLCLTVQAILPRTCVLI